MDKLTQIMHLLVEFFAYAYILIVVLRFLLQLVRADFYNPLSQFIVKATNPLIIPLRRLIPGLLGVDIASIILALTLQMLALQLLALILGHGWMEFFSLLMSSSRELIKLVLNIYFFSFIIMVVVSWIAPYTSNPALSLVASITEPVLRPIRQVVPPMGGLDFSVMIAMLAIVILKILIGVG